MQRYYTIHSLHPWDTYQGEDIVAFEEFNSSFRLQDMLNYLDSYPLKLGARYSDRQACYTKVFIISNLPLTEQYKNIQKDEKDAYCRPQNLKEHISSSRVLKLWTLLYPQYNIERLWEYKSYSNYVEYRVTEKATGKVVFEKVTANALLEAVREEYYDYKNY